MRVEEEGINVQGAGSGIHMRGKDANHALRPAFLVATMTVTFGMQLGHVSLVLWTLTGIG